MNRQQPAPLTLDPAHFAHGRAGATHALQLLGAGDFEPGASLHIPARATWILELQ